MPSELHSKKTLFSNMQHAPQQAANQAKILPVLSVGTYGAT
jgi:hypothetical protein